MLNKPIRLLAMLGLMMPCCQLLAQAPIDTAIELKGALQLAEQHYHLLKSVKYEADAATRHVDVVKYNWLPTIDASYQAGMGTANNLTGIFYPGNILPMTGPPATGNDYKPVTGSAASILLNWQAVSFGQKNAQNGVAIAEANTKKMQWQQLLFQQKINVISAYLDLLLAYDMTAIHKSNIRRVEASLYQSRVLANTGLKPGVDTALFLSELSKANIDFLKAQKQLAVNQLLLAQLVVTNAMPVPADSVFLSRLPVVARQIDSSFSKAPLIQLGKSQFLLSQSREQLLKKSWYPKLNVWGTGFARGSGFETSGVNKTWDGLGMNRFNYSAGVQLVFPLMKYGEIKKQLQQQNLLSQAAAEQIEESKTSLTAQEKMAAATFASSLAVATETVQQLKSGQYAFNAMQIRYNTGLVGFADLIQAQYNLLKAELDLKLAHWDAWKALLLQAAIKGDEQIFLNEIR